MAGHKKEASSETPRSKPLVIPHWSDAEMMSRIEDGLRRGNSEVSVSLREGMSEKTVSTWISRWRTEAERLISDREAGIDSPASEFVRAVSPIARARGEWLASAELLALASDPGAMWALPRRCASVWGTQQTVTVDAPDPSRGIAALLGKLAEPGEAG